MLLQRTFFTLALVAQLELARAAYLPFLEYSGETFFDRWTFYGNVDNTTWGNVTFNDQANATRKQLVGLTDSGNAIVRVDNVNQLAPAELVLRDSVRITTVDAFDFGSLLIADFVHMPYGCSVWPSLWTVGDTENWPVGGEIDIVEGINQMTFNQYAIHGSTGCTQPEGNVGQTGTAQFNLCYTGRGCTVAENKENSFGAGFARAGGGVFALQYETTGIKIWFWSRPDVPENIRDTPFTGSVDVSGWGLPTAYYPNGPHCELTQYFKPQQLVLLTTLCGLWAGVPDIYQSTCPTATGSCFNDNVLGPASNFDNAYWEIKHIRAFYNEELPKPTLARLPGENDSIPSSKDAAGGNSTATGANGTNDTKKPVSSGYSSASMATSVLCLSVFAWISTLFL